jgi:predicted RNase H-like HicB family nuclease
MNSEIIFVVEEAAEGGYLAKAFGESIFTEGETMNDVKQNVKEAVLTHFEGETMPSIIRLHFVKEELIKV